MCSSAVARRYSKQVVQVLNSREGCGIRPLRGAQLRRTSQTYHGMHHPSRLRQSRGSPRTIKVTQPKHNLGRFGGQFELAGRARGLGKRPR